MTTMQARKKAFTKRSRTGCQACRTRRIKCDETLGGCKNCKSAGWKCEGFDAVRLSKLGKRDLRWTSPTLTLQRINGNLPAGNVEEHRAFAFFQCLTVPSLTGYFDSRLWTDLILPMSHSERAVNHAIVALSALHEDSELRGAPLSKENLTLAHHRFALNQYGRSLAALNERRHSQDPKLREVILTCCLLFVAFDLMRGQYDPGLLHLKQGLAIVEETLPNSSGIDAVGRSLFATMARFETQSVFYGLPPSAISSEGSGFDDRRGFQTPSEARGALDRILAQVVRLLAAAYTVPLEERLPEQQPDLARQQAEIRLQLFKFEQYFHLYETRDPSRKSRKEQRGLDLIHLHYITFSILLETTLCGTDSSVFDDYVNYFQQMLHLSKRISDSFLGESHPASRPTLLLDMGIISPLFFVCLKCHDFNLRLQALGLLESWPHREGLWDSRLLVIFIKQQFQLEIEVNTLACDFQASGRVQELSLEVSDDQRHATIRYQTLEPGQKPRKQQRIISLDEDSK
ncbi:uncharacterized protein N7459_007117 [Penicillium hispanicum]|uniref:uncharacterized protein n=1 Tax=Penicillium hispanicum TaxID=1080232 RepID=UPI0025411230|nr:uncharacterized protein N7459_007117 [Penicillium hispanicum]KAJ5578153.1 hypothetical protein N7459_007117 [Penicillium hispanicum]